MRRLLFLSLAGLWLFSPAAAAQLPGLISQPLAGGGQSWSLSVQTLVFITSLTFLPAILLMMTSFTRIIIVFGLLRNALGTPSAPPNQVLLGLALFLTFLLCRPSLTRFTWMLTSRLASRKFLCRKRWIRRATVTRVHVAPNPRSRSGAVCPSGQ